MNGLFDPRMGTVEPGLVCPTDGHDYMTTPGFFGHLELARPVFYIQFLTTVVKVLRCVCYKCSKLLITPPAPAFTDKDAKAMWDRVFPKASKVQRCGDSNENGCGCKQPDKISKEGLATITAEWSDLEEGNPKTTVRITPEVALRILRRITDEDVDAMGFSSIWSRPDWMVCQVLAIPPPAIRPSVKHDSQQRSEDDISHILINIIKANKTLQDKILQDAAENVIEDWTTVLQYYIATMINNKLPGVSHVTQRSGRPLKSVIERLQGKHGRLRGNLQGKRVDFSSRSVITPDPNLGIAQLGVPITIAKNITRPERVNTRNIKALTSLVKAGPDAYPGAKVLERANGDNISLRYVDRESLVLHPGDVVHRHLVDGDPVLFNRQPTLHRMSMMCHTVKVMRQGSTFRMNVADTVPYNADFDGDEMNMHGPQSDEAAAELLYLAAVPKHIISPATNSPIVGIFQDSLLGAYRLTREGVTIPRQQVMNLLMSLRIINIDDIASPMVPNNNILSQLMPPLSCDFSNGTDGPNNRVRVRRGEYISGQMNKSVLGSTSKGLIHSIYNDYGSDAAANFIDNLQAVVTDYMKQSAYSVGVSDLVADAQTSDKIAAAISQKKQQVKDLSDLLLRGAFENKTGKTNAVEFETQVNGILNKAQEEAGKIGRQSLSADNRFNIMVAAGSKGKPLNIAQMICCLGQQNVDGQRIPYGFESRTLPHFPKFDDSPAARGFVESSFIEGLTPTELFFHAMGGRVGLIDTAVKTSQTGYIQRRLIKGLEDIHVTYKGTVVNSRSKIIQFLYGSDGIDPIRIETQSLPLVSMPLEELYAHFAPPGKDTVAVAFTVAASQAIAQEKVELAQYTKTLIDKMISSRAGLLSNVFAGDGNGKVHTPVCFRRLLENYTYQLGLDDKSRSDITPLAWYKMLDSTIAALNTTYCVTTDLFEIMAYYWLRPQSVLVQKRFSKKGAYLLLDGMRLAFLKSLVQPGEMVGMIAAQSIGEPTTQMTLNTFHFAGVASKSNVTRGVPRIEEILSISANPKNPSATVWLNPSDLYDKVRAQEVMYMLEHTRLKDIAQELSIHFDPSLATTALESDRGVLREYHAFQEVISGCVDEKAAKNPSRWVVRLVLDRAEMLDRNITPEDVHFTIHSGYGNDIECVYSDYNSDSVLFRLRMTDYAGVKKRAVESAHPLDQSDEVYVLRALADQILENTVLRGVPGISKVTMRKMQNHLTLVDGSYEGKDAWVLDTVGTNLMDLCGLSYVDGQKTTSNNIQEVHEVLGIEAARQTIFNELVEVLEYDGTYINYHHLDLLCDRMAVTKKMVSIFRHGINNDDIGTIAKASFEETPEMFLRAARHGLVDYVRGVSANVMLGQQGHFGTGLPSVIVDTEALSKMADAKLKSAVDIEAAFGVDVEGDVCSRRSLESTVTADAIPASQTGGVPEDYDLGF
jgi:DNA-directed RNA polymerase II subunit RPB1